MKKGALLLVLVLVFCMSACQSASVPPTEPSYTAYRWEKSDDNDPLGGFIITLCDDGTFNYRENAASSYHGEGTWRIDNGILCMTDGGESNFINYFSVQADSLLYLANISTGFFWYGLDDIAELDVFHKMQ